MSGLLRLRLCESDDVECTLHARSWRGTTLRAVYFCVSCTVARDWYTALTECSSAADNGSKRFLSGEFGSGRLGLGAGDSLEGEVTTLDGWLYCLVSALGNSTLAVSTPFSVTLVVGRAALVLVWCTGPPRPSETSCVDGGYGQTSAEGL